MSIWKIIQFWICYFLPLFPAVPTVGRLEEADCVFVQAFGRNHWDDHILGLLLERIKNISSGELAMLEALKKIGFQPGKPNFALAMKAKQLYDQCHLPIIAQWEIVYTLFWLDEQWYFDHQQGIDCIWPVGEYFSTYHEKAISLQKMESRGCKKPLELAHPAMVVRAVMTIWKRGVVPIVIGVSPFSFWKEELWAWDRDSVQWWTRFFLLWLIRETPGRAKVIQLGWISFWPPRS